MKNLTYQRTNFDLPGVTFASRKIEFDVRPKSGATRDTAISAGDYTAKLAQDPKRLRQLKAARMRLGTHVAKLEPQSLKAMRLKTGMSQRELGLKVGMSQVQIARLEGETPNPTFETLCRISVALQQPVPVVASALLARCNFDHFPERNNEAGIQMKRYLTVFAADVFAGPAAVIRQLSLPRRLNQHE